MTDLDDLRREFVDALARSFAEGVASLPDRGSIEITDAIRDLAMSSQHLTDALDSFEPWRDTECRCTPSYDCNFHGEDI